ncbi:MAG: hypothetical protein K0Q59_528 [Paenibacillus sp.]|jgi:predicted amidophosphoribosyltransferase|nr:hypothetical protein [Paenibacillus sp.]
MSIRVDNCPNCGAVYQKNSRQLCAACCEKVDSALDECIDYLWKHPGSNADDLSTAAQIPVTTIYKFIKEGKLAKSYINLAYPCECCGAFIRENRLCSSCSRTFKDTAMQIKASLTRTTANVYNIRK